MTTDRYFRDSRHGQLLPEGTPLIHLMAAVLPHVQAEAIRQGGLGRLKLDLRSWVPAIQQAATPIISAYFRRGYSDRAGAMRKRIAPRRSKALPPVRDVRHGFATTQPEVSKYIRDQTFAFAESTMATATQEGEAALAAVRDELGAAHDNREGRAEIAARMRKIFSDPARAARVGVTEACRAVNAGSYQSAIDSGIVSGHVWKSNANACPFCRGLEGQFRKLGAPFVLLDHGRDFYRIVMHPPAHPHCSCVLAEELDVSGIDIPTVDQHLAGMMDVGTRPKPTARPRPSKPRVYYGGFQADGWYYENGRRRAHPQDPLGGRWDDVSKPWRMWWDK